MFAGGFANLFTAGVVISASYRAGHAFSAFIKDTQQGTETLADFNKRMKDAAIGQAQLRKNLVKGGLFAAGATMLGAGIKSAAKEAGELELVLTSIQQLTSSSAADMQRFKSQLLVASDRTKFEMVDVAAQANQLFSMLPGLDRGAGGFSKITAVMQEASELATILESLPGKRFAPEATMTALAQGINMLGGGDYSKENLTSIIRAMGATYLTGPYSDPVRLTRSLGFMQGIPAKIDKFEQMALINQLVATGIMTGRSAQVAGRAGEEILKVMFGKPKGFESPAQAAKREAFKSTIGLDTVNYKDPRFLQRAFFTMQQRAQSMGEEEWIKHTNLFTAQTRRVVAKLADPNYDFTAQLMKLTQMTKEAAESNFITNYIDATIGTFNVATDRFTSNVMDLWTIMGLYLTPAFTKFYNFLADGVRAVAEYMIAHQHFAKVLMIGASTLGGILATLAGAGLGKAVGGFTGGVLGSAILGPGVGTAIGATVGTALGGFMYAPALNAMFGNETEKTEVDKKLEGILKGGMSVSDQLAAIRASWKKELPPLLGDEQAKAFLRYGLGPDGKKLKSGRKGGGSLFGGDIPNEVPYGRLILATITGKLTDVSDAFGIVTKASLSAANGLGDVAATSKAVVEAEKEKIAHISKYKNINLLKPAQALKGDSILAAMLIAAGGDMEGGIPRFKGIPGAQRFANHGGMFNSFNAGKPMSGYHKGRKFDYNQTTNQRTENQYLFWAISQVLGDLLTPDSVVNPFGMGINSGKESIESTKRAIRRGTYSKLPRLSMPNVDVMEMKRGVKASTAVGQQQISEIIKDIHSTTRKGHTQSVSAMKEGVVAALREYHGNVDSFGVPRGINSTYESSTIILGNEAINSIGTKIESGRGSTQNTVNRSAPQQPMSSSNQTVMSIPGR